MTVSDGARFWDKAARKYAADPIADMVGYERTLNAVRALLKPSDAVLEVGCGTGTTALKLAGAAARYLGTDVSSEMIAIAREKAASEGAAGVSFEVGTPNAPPWPDASADVALAFNLLHLVPDRAAALAGIHRVLKPGGLFISKTPCLAEMNPLLRLAVPLMRGLGRAPFVAFFDAAALESDIAAAGFDILARERHGARGKDSRIFLVARKA